MLLDGARGQLTG